ncbi:hypothetical protein MMC24_001892 [Lignoscripta atroalba]|nr:hypothetical protein [Lignoscripta atroalba]
MPKFYDSSFSYDYSFPAVTLAYFLRYPNPYSTHVLSTDVISRHFDPSTQTLSTTRLHLKRSKLPPAVLKLLPKGLLGGSAAQQDGGGQSYILEKSVIDIKQGRMETESRNLEWTGILSVVERQVYTRQQHGGMRTEGHLAEHAKDETTDVTTTVIFNSRFGQAKLLGNNSRRKIESATPESVSDTDDETPPKKGFFSSWSTTSLQRTIEAMGVRRTRDALVKSKEGMNVVLERLRQGGLVGVLEGMRRDREAAFGSEGPWKRVWAQQQQQQQGQGREVSQGDDGGRPRIHNDPFEDD